LPDPDVFTEEQWARANALLDVEEVCPLHDPLQELIDPPLGA
jgi:hypothetical protein